MKNAVIAFVLGIVVGAGAMNYADWTIIAEQRKTLDKAKELLHEGLSVVDGMVALNDSLTLRIRCLEAAGADCTEPRTIGGGKIRYGGRLRSGAEGL
jgi:hypothetical protein